MKVEVEGDPVLARSIMIVCVSDNGSQPRPYQQSICRIDLRMSDTETM